MKIKALIISLTAVALITTPLVFAAGSGAPAPDFFSKSWEQTEKADLYKADCTVNAGPLKKTSPMTP
ncbi:MAG: hypothetical protein L0Y76_02660, partial [Ignavibacteria bacterium]|nr:hypothetical protein [Ignavibacteria bacterium]